MRELVRNGFLVALIFCETVSVAKVADSRQNQSLVIRNEAGESIQFRVQVDDGDVTVTPELTEAQRGSIFGLKFNRGRPLKLSVPNYRAEELFTLGGQMWVTLSDAVNPKERYLAKLEPRLDRVTSGTVAKKLEPDLVPMGLVTFGLVYVANDFTWTGAIMAAEGALFYLTDVVLGMRDQLRRRYARGETKVHTNVFGDRLRVVQFLYGEDWSIRDVVVQTNEGWKYSLKTGFRCANLIGPSSSPARADR